MAFGRRMERPVAGDAMKGLRPSPDLLAYALERAAEDSLRQAILKRLYQNLTPAEQRVCGWGAHIRPLAAAA